jgi:dTDP-4-dehydrorhamnose 3,5-epimerase
MEFRETPLAGVFQIDIQPRNDSRGYFARTWCDREAAVHGLRTTMVQDSLAFNREKGTLRGLHYHAPEFPQSRVIRCVAGASVVVVVDLRSESHTYLDVWQVPLDAEAHRALYVPPGVALGYQTLVNDTVIAYKMPEFYDPAFERGVRWNDARFAIKWPDRQPTISARDAAFPDYDGPARRDTGRAPAR